MLILLPLCASAAVPRTISTSRQFIVFGDDAHLRGSVAQAAELTKRDLLAILQIADRWSVPILVNLTPAQTNVPEVQRAALYFSQTGAGLKIQLDLVIDRDFEPAILRSELVRALLLELSYRSLPALAPGQIYTQAPDWLVAGILAWNDMSPELLNVLENAEPIPLKDLLALHPALLDSQSRLLYRASACALLHSILEAPNGRAQLVRFIADLPNAPPDSIGDLRAHFPFLGKNENETEKIWRADVQRLTKSADFPLLTFRQTSEQLDDCLQQSIGRNTEPLTLEESAQARRAAIDKHAAAALGERLMLLGTRAHPLLRPIIEHYERAAAGLARNSRPSAKAMAGTAALRRAVNSRMREVDDYMNWFEATQAAEPSGAFAGYLRSVQGEDAAPPRRRDPISIYLDAMEAQVQ